MFEVLIRLIKESDVEDLGLRIAALDFDLHTDDWHELRKTYYDVFFQKDASDDLCKIFADIDIKYSKYFDGYLQLINELYQCKDSRVIELVFTEFVKESSRYLFQAYFLYSLLTRCTTEKISHFLSHLTITEIMFKYDLKLAMYALILTDQAKKIALIHSKIELVDELLFFAVRSKKHNIANFFLDMGKTPNLANIVIEPYESLLSIAVKNQDLAMVKLLRKRGASNKTVTRDYAYAHERTVIDVLEIAAQNPNIQIIETLISTPDELNDALYIMIRFKHVDIFKYLMDKHTIKEKIKFSLLRNAISLGNTEIIDFMLGKIKDLNQSSDDIKLFHDLFKSKNLTDKQKLTYAKTFIERGLDIHCMDNFQLRVVDMCARYGNPEMLQLLESKGVDLRGFNTLYYAFFGRNVATVKYLLGKGLAISCAGEIMTLFMAPLCSLSTIYHEERELKEIISLALSLSININATVDLGYPVFPRKPTCSSTALHAVIEKYAVIEICSKETPFLVRTLLEAGANPNIASCDTDSFSKKQLTPLDILLSSKCDKYTDHAGIVSNNIKRMYVAGLLIDHGAKLTDNSLHMYDRHSWKGTVSDGRIWPHTRIYFEALELQSKQNFAGALEGLDRCGNYDFICCRRAKLHQLMGNYALAFKELLIIVSKQHENADSSSFSIDNELVDLFYAWNKSLQSATAGSIPTAFDELFAIVQVLSHDNLTVNNHWKLAEICLQSEGYTFSQRREILYSHLVRVTHGEFKDTANRILSNLLTPENAFKHILDKIITNDDTDIMLKKSLLLREFSAANDHLKNVGIIFLLDHERIKKTKPLLEVVKRIRQTAVTNLLRNADKLFASENSEKALDNLRKAKDQPLFNKLKGPYLFKHKTKAVAKIECKIKAFSK